MIRFIHRFRWFILLISIGIAVALALQVPRIRIDAEVQAMIPETMDSKINTDKIEALFGGSQMIMILIQSGDILDESVLTQIQGLDEAVKGLPEIARTLSLFSLKEIEGLEGSMIVSPAIPMIPSNPEEKEILRNRLLSNELVSGVVVSQDFTLAAIICTLNQDADDQNTVLAIEQIVESHGGPGSVYLGGYPVVGQSITENILHDILLLLPLAILFMLLVLGFTMKDLKGVLLPLSVVLMSMIVAVGLIPIAGWKFALVTVLLPVMMVAIGNNYGIYLINRYHEILNQDPGITKPNLLTQLNAALTRPILACALTTIAGVLALTTHIIVPAREVGLLAAIGIAWALILSLLYIPAMLDILPVTRVRKHQDKPHITRIGHLLFRTGVGITRHPGRVLIFAGLFTILAASGMIRLRVEGNTVNFFSQKDPVRVTSNLIDQHFGGSQTVLVHFSGDIRDPEILKNMDRYEKTLKSEPAVGQVMSLASVIRLMSKALLDPGDPGYDAIPETREGVAQYLELYSMSGDPSDFEQLVDFNYENAQLIIRIKDGRSSAVLELVDKIRVLTKEDPTVASIGGIGLVSAELTDSLVKGQWRSTFFAIGIVCLLVIWIFRSWKAGILILVPLVMACLVLFGLMGWFGIPLDPATTLITSVMIGCGVDYTIQYLWRHKTEVLSGLSGPRAVIKTLFTTGQAITFNALAVMVGFSPLIISSFSPIRFFGLMMLLSILICLIGALILVPALTILTNPGFLKKKDLSI